MHGVETIELFRNPVVRMEDGSDLWKARSLDLGPNDEVVQACGRTRGEALVHLASLLDQQPENKDR